MEEAKSSKKVRQKFLTAEIEHLIETNRLAIQARSMSASKRGIGRTSIVVVCMDGRTHQAETALGLDKTTTVRFASGGGKIELNDFLRLHAPLLTNDGSRVTILLTTHEVVGYPNLGCAAFNCDMPEQRRYFTALRQSLAQRLPEAWIHAVSHDTSTDGLWAIELDQRNEAFVELVKSGGKPLPKTQPNKAHGEYGIYVGDQLHAWVAGYNTYFHISSAAPSLRGDLDIALSVMLHHSKVDLSNKPIVLLLDRPTGDDPVSTEQYNQARIMTEDFLRSSKVTELMESGRIRLVELETNPTTWSGRVVTTID